MGERLRKSNNMKSMATKDKKKLELMVILDQIEKKLSGWKLLVGL
jgi:hypothetical protein